MEFHTGAFTGLSPPAPGVQAERIIALAEQAGFLLPHLSQKSMEIAQNLIHRLNAKVPDMRPVHGDFYDKQAVIHNGNVRLIDLDSARLDNPLIDVGNYIAHLEKRAVALRLDPAGVKQQKEGLVNAYQQWVGHLDMESLDNYIALGLFRLIHEPFKDWAGNWPEQIEQLLGRVEDLLVT